MEDATDVSAGQRGFMTAVNAAWKGPRAAEVRLLPENLGFASLPAIGHAPDKRIPYAVDELELAPVYLETMSEPHFVAFGAPSRASRTCCGCS
ncbi:hypothetical protein G7085_09435 [Tessaracoccus sp. HDW20]|uniref:hypothetical protein n=1 Tax=Tessaracoccus coleopterorum TaxID=2714950 RepID=UPI0018D29EC6|nr:hypothetical protein [Tessaracoccus coleopterorum]NHB84754.1 hypothetical protein [Tessaracoccus coleopterorum]